MGGKKKKSLANKLAKMSDEERARYLQHRADVEEEARRRKEQLIATFMKKKIKKEEAFSRLNLAKINQHWHQILRKTKCKEMKENVEHMKKWIDRVITYKNRTISNLMQELEDTEEQYLNNFQSHSNHIEKIIDDQKQHLDKLQNEYDEDLEELLTSFHGEMCSILKTANSDIEYLKTVFHAQESIAGKTLRETRENYMQRCYETECEYEEKLNNFKEESMKIFRKIWQDIALLIEQYVKETDKRRAHLSELKRLDNESGIEIEENNLKIKKQEELVADLNEQYDKLLSERENEIKSTVEVVDNMNKSFFEARKMLQTELKIDENKLRLLAEHSNKALDYLEKILRKGSNVQCLVGICKKLESEKETLSQYLLLGKGQISFKKDVEEIVETSIDEKEKVLTKPRPKTAIPSSPNEETPTPDWKKNAAVKTVTIQEKHEQAAASTSPKPLSTGVFEKCYENARSMEKFWETYNKVEVNCLELKQEKKILENENKQLRGMLRALLEAAVLEKSIPESKVSTRLNSRTRSAYSVQPKIAI